MSFNILLKDVTKSNLTDKLIKAVQVVDNSNKKLADQIRKKQGYKTSNIKVQEQLEANYIKIYEKMTDTLISSLARDIGFKLYKADDESIFKIKGKIVYNPKSGKPLTNKEWKLIKDAIDKFLSTNTADLEEKMAVEQQALGTILQRLETQGVRIEDVTQGQIKDNIYDNMNQYQKAYDWQDEELYNLDLSMARLGHHITGINEDIRRDIITVLNDGIVNGKTQKEISRDLLDKMGDRNRDWQKICSYESQYNFQNGYMNSELHQADLDETVYMQAISQADACRYCKSLLDGKIYILRRVDIKEKLKDEYAEGFIILGHTNIGRNPADYIATIPMHPHCRCRFVRWHPEFAELESAVENPDPRVGQ